MWAITSFTCASPAFPEAVVTFTRKNSGLPNDRVVALAPGADGALWIGTEGGLARLDKGQQRSALVEGNSDQTKAIALS